MLFSQASLLLAVSSVVAAAPLEKKWFGFGSWQGAESSAIDSILNFGKRHSWGGRTVATGLCNVAAAQMPSCLTLYHVAVGRGTQNYTCDPSNATAAPVAVGAVADLFNVTCMSADYPILLNAVPKIAVNIPIPATADPSSPAYQDLSAHHYFTDMTTPFFDLRTTLSNYGRGAFKKAASVAAPADAMAGSVAWLKLTTKDANQWSIQEIYRVNTAGGSPPATCQGQQAAFDVQYSAEYWFYGN